MSPRFPSEPGYWLLARGLYNNILPQAICPASGAAVCLQSCTVHRCGLVVSINIHFQSALPRGAGDGNYEVQRLPQLSNLPRGEAWW